MENRDTEVGAAVERAVKSKQPQFSGSRQEAVTLWLKDLYRWTKDALLEIKPRGLDNRARDKWLLEFAQQEPLWMGVKNSIVDIDKNRGWTFVGGRNQVNYYSRLLRNVNPTVVRNEIVDAEGWRRFASRQSQAYWGTDLGYITEIGLADNGALGALWSVDPTKCALTRDPEFPLKYYPSGQSEPQQWPAGSFFGGNSMPDLDETLGGLGYCATSRAMDLIIVMVGVYRHDRELLYSAIQKGLLLLSGIDEADWEDAMTTHSEALTAKEREYFGGLSILFSDAKDADMKLLALSQLPQNFDIVEFSSLLMNGYALVTGFDPREFWPVSGGTLGTGRETEVQSLKATSKGGLDFALSFQDNLQRWLPATLRFQFEQRNEQGELLQAELAAAYAEAVNLMAASPIQGTETLTREERRSMYAARGLIPEDWTLDEEPTVATDTDAVRDRWLQYDEVQRSCRQYPDEPLVAYTWPAGISRVLYSRAGDALPKHFSVVKRQIEIEPPVTLDDEEAQAQVDAYTAALALLVAALQDNELTRDEFVTQLSDLVQQYAVAVYLTTTGKTVGELTDDDLQAIDEYITVNQEAAPGLADAILAGQDAEDPESGELGLVERLGLWIMSLVGLNTLAELQTEREQYFMFVLGNTIEHCTDCLRLNGQVHTADEWLASGLYPQSPNLECGGWNCDCRLVPVEGPARGDF